METFDHKVSYGDFAGNIPEGTYGAGEVLSWDKGTFELLDVEYDNKYIIDFNGKKLKGIYALIKTGSGKNFLWIKVKDTKKYSSIIDYPHNEFLPHFWTFITGEPHVRDAYADKIIINLYRAFRKAGFKNISSWVTNITLTGSAVTNLYNEKSDIDINVEIDYNKFKNKNNNLNIKTDTLLRDFIRDRVTPKTDGYFINNIKIRYLITGKGIKVIGDYYYDLLKREWVDKKIPKFMELDYNPDIKLKKEKAIARKVCGIYNMLLDDIVLKIRELGKLENYLKLQENQDLTDAKLDLEKDIIKNLKQIEKLNQKLEVFRGLRFKLPKNKLKYPYKKLNENWEAHNIIYKYIEFFGYSNLTNTLKNRIPEEYQNIYNRLELTL